MNKLIANVVGVALLGDPKIGYTGRRRQRPLHQKSKFQKQNTIIQITIYKKEVENEK